MEKMEGGGPSESGSLNLNFQGGVLAKKGGLWRISANWEDGCSVARGLAKWE